MLALWMFFWSTTDWVVSTGPSAWLLNTNQIIPPTVSLR